MYDARNYYDVKFHLMNVSVRHSLEDETSGGEQTRVARAGGGEGRGCREAAGRNRGRWSCGCGDTNLCTKSHRAIDREKGNFTVYMVFKE